MLAAQMEAAVYTASMTFVRRLANVENILLEDSAERAFNKLTRTFPAPHVRVEGISLARGPSPARGGRNAAVSPYFRPGFALPTLSSAFDFRATFQTVRRVLILHLFSAGQNFLRVRDSRFWSEGGRA